MADTAEKDQSFDVDARGERREKAPITIGGVEYFQRRRNNQVLIETRELLRRRERTMRYHGRELERLARKDNELDGYEPDYVFREEEPEPKRKILTDKQIDKLETERAEIEQRALDLDNEATGHMLAQIQMMLRDKEGEAPSMEFLKDKIDIADVGPLLRRVSAIVAEPDPLEPTPTPSEPS